MILTTPRRRITPTVEATDTTTCAEAKCSEGMGTPSERNTRNPAASLSTRAPRANRRPAKHDDGARQRHLSTTGVAPVRPIQLKKRRAVIRAPFAFLQAVPAT